MHDRISVNNLCFPGVPLATDIERWRSLGAHQVATSAMKINAEGWDQSVEMLRGLEFKFATMVHPFMAPNRLDADDKVESVRKDLSRTLAAAKTLGSKTVYMTTGGRGRAQTWEEAARSFCSAVAPCAEEARNAGVELLIEPAPTLYADLHLPHTLRDTVQLAEQAGIGVCLDIFSSWTEPQLRETIERAMKRCHLVQVSDYVLGDRALSCRAVPGDGAIPLERIIGWILEAGYRGAFDLELLGPRIDKEGHYEAVRRTCDRLGEILVRLGA
ncbi:MAG: sugar phosphate isomerase/epimerase [Rhodospirillaceae bacterium]|nr:MAG: sugar phosphate isomerase/epimerase [Rhodospirillaceae bacterium]